MAKPKTCGTCRKHWEQSCRAGPPTAHIMPNAVPGKAPIVLGVYPRVTPAQPGCFAHEAALEEIKS